ncbi:MAG: class I SAM-dependent DNA methyltransferase, partial [Synergistaceae bacterium]|nr:class I SAM-dependent DNA methyltransferase [Synergistaceae bacterium]
MKNFIERWKNTGDEKSDTQKFWLEFLRDVLNVERPEEIIEFEKRVELAHKSFIDAYIPKTRVIIEQKSFDINLDKAAKQSDGTFKTPFEQAKRYSDWLPDSERARWIITCNFQEFHVHDMERPKAPPEVIKLENLDPRKFKFLVDIKGTTPKDIREEEISIKAGGLVKKLKESLKSRYQNPTSKSALKSLTVLCVRIVFLLYAEDSNLLSKSQFHDFLKKQSNPRRALIDLFTVLSQKIPERDFYLDDDLKNFPYVNGGLFEEKNVEIPQLDGEPLEIILSEMSEGFDWSGISPTIFGAIFESVLDSDERRSGGMHYTSIENIHKVIEPLFLNSLNDELENIFSMSKSATRTRKLNDFQKKLGSLKFLDPACGSGNFLTETYLCLRKLENRILADRRKQVEFVQSKDEADYIKVSISQFYGIEINDFAVAVARTALWIAEAQMFNETKQIVQVLEDFLPLKTFNNIIEANALALDWREVIKSEELNFIMGNPPFIGASMMTKEQKSEAVAIFGKVPRANSIDYVGAWYHKAANFIQGSNIRAAFVSTNSITQGEQVAPLWKKLFEDFKIQINFAWRTFKWSSEAKDKAQVHVVIIGFSQIDSPVKKIFDGENVIEASNINAYLVDAPNVLIMPR